MPVKLARLRKGVMNPVTHTQWISMLLVWCSVLRCIAAGSSGVSPTPLLLHAACYVTLLPYCCTSSRRHLRGNSQGSCCPLSLWVLSSHWQLLLKGDPHISCIKNNSHEAMGVCSTLWVIKSGWGSLGKKGEAQSSDLRKFSFHTHMTRRCGQS